MCQTLLLEEAVHAGVASKLTVTLNQWTAEMPTVWNFPESGNKFSSSKAQLYDINISGFINELSTDVLIMKSKNENWQDTSGLMGVEHEGEASSSGWEVNVQLKSCRRMKFSYFSLTLHFLPSPL